MNIFTKYSIELANQKDYLDKLFSVYPLSPNSICEINKDIWHDIEEYYKSYNNVELFKSLLKLKLFPIKDSYVSFFNHAKSAVERNPLTVNRICGRIRELGLDKLYERCTQPKEANRQIGPLFTNWLNSGILGCLPIEEYAFLKAKYFAILKGTGQSLKEFAHKYLNYNRDKGLENNWIRKD